MNNPLETLAGYEPHTSYEEHARRIRERLVAERLARIAMKGECDDRFRSL